MPVLTHSQIDQILVNLPAVLDILLILKNLLMHLTGKAIVISGIFWMLFYTHPAPEDFYPAPA